MVSLKVLILSSGLVAYFLVQHMSPDKGECSQHSINALLVSFLAFQRLVMIAGKAP